MPTFNQLMLSICTTHMPNIYCEFNFPARFSILEVEAPYVLERVLLSKYPGGVYTSIPDQRYEKAFTLTNSASYF